MVTTRSVRKPATRRLIAAFTAAFLFAAVPAWAITAGDVLDRMTEQERFQFVNGSVEMAMYLASAQEKNDAKAECILNWFYGKNASGPKQVIDTFRRYRDKPAVALINVLINQTCRAK